MSQTQMRPTVGFELTSISQVLALLEFWVQNQSRWLLDKPSVPHPYQAGLRYKRERKGRERWQTIAQTINRKFGDCEDLSLYLAAWYRARKGINAKVILKRFQKGPIVWYHAVVQLPDGTILDPSKKLGMGAP